MIIRALIVSYRYPLSTASGVNCLSIIWGIRECYVKSDLRVRLAAFALQLRAAGAVHVLRDAASMLALAPGLRWSLARLRAWDFNGLRSVICARSSGFSASLRTRLVGLPSAWAPGYLARGRGGGSSVLRGLRLNFQAMTHMPYTGRRDSRGKEVRSA